MRDHSSLLFLGGCWVSLPNSLSRWRPPLLLPTPPPATPAPPCQLSRSPPSLHSLQTPLCRWFPCPTSLQSSKTGSLTSLELLHLEIPQAPWNQHNPNWTHHPSKANLLGSPLSVNRIVMSLGAQLQTFTLPFSESRSPADPAPTRRLASGPTTTFLLQPSWLLTRVLQNLLTHPRISHRVSASTPNHPTATRSIDLKAQPNLTLPHRKAALSCGEWATDSNRQVASSTWVTVWRHGTEHSTGLMFIFQTISDGCTFIISILQIRKLWRTETLNQLAKAPQLTPGFYSPFAWHPKASHSATAICLSCLVGYHSLPKTLAHFTPAPFSLPQVSPNPRLTQLSIQTVHAEQKSTAC